LGTLVSAAVPGDDGSVDFYSASEWFPDTQGFAGMRGGGIFLAPASFRQGVFALTSRSLVFVQWDSKQESYALLYRAAFSDILSTKVDSFGRNRRLVVFGKDYRVQSFGINGPKGALVDQTATQEAYDLVSRRIPVAEQSQ
jgi:hypothetical protein